MRIRTGPTTLAALAMAALAIGAAGPAGAAPPNKPAKAVDQSANVVDPGALAAVTKMGEYLAGLKSFELKAETTVEVVLRRGHQVEVGGEVQYFVRRPDRLRINSTTDTLTRQYFYDGTSLTVVAPVESYFAQAKVKPTIRETLAQAAQELNIELPLADLFDWGTDVAPQKQFQRGFYVGESKVRGVLADHYAFAGKDFGWEVWIKAGDTPLPLKMSVVDYKAPGAPRFTAVLSWTPDAQIPDDTFVFTPGDLKKIEFAKPATKPSPKGGK